MKTIALHIQKGGEGKTSLAGNLAFLLSRFKQKVLLVDLDHGQGNLSTWLIPPGYEIKYEVGDYFNNINSRIANESRSIENLIIPIRKNKGGGSLDLIPTFGVNSSLKEYCEAKAHKPEEIDTARKFIKDLEPFNYDFVIFDLAPSMLSFEKNLTYAIDEFIIPVTPSFFGVDGVEINNQENKLIEKYRNMKREYPLKRSKVILNRRDRRVKKHKEIEKTLKNHNKDLFIVREASLMGNVMWEGLFVAESQKNNGIINDLIDIAKILYQEKNKNAC